MGARLANFPPADAFAKKLGLLRAQWPSGIVVRDLRRPLPWRDASVDAIYCSHVLEHLSRQDGKSFLRQCHRVLRPGGIIRLVVPDLALVVGAYLRGGVAGEGLLESLGTLATRDGDGLLKRRFAPFFRYPHLCMYDEAALVRVATNAGFVVRARRPFESDILDIRAIEGVGQTRTAVIVEGTRPRFSHRTVAANGQRAAGGSFSPVGEMLGAEAFEDCGLGATGRFGLSPARVRGWLVKERQRP